MKDRETTLIDAPGDAPEAALLADALRLLADRVERVAAQEARSPVARVTVPVPAVNPFRWLAEQPAGTRSLWSPRDGARVCAMWGLADVYEGGDKGDFDRLRTYLAQQLRDAEPSVRYFGGLRFDEAHVASAEWASFGLFRFTLPRFELTQGPAGAELSCNLLLRRDRSRLNEITAAILGMAWPGTTGPASLPKATGRHDMPSRAEWIDRIEHALDTIQQHEIQKVVLARRSTFQFERTLSSVDLMERVFSETPNRFHYLFEAPDGAAFLGATPERLVHREGDFVFSEAVAGTRPAVDDEVDDAELRDALMASEKDQREHLCVRWAIEDILRPFCEELDVDAHASEMRLSRGRHLVSRFQGVLRDGVETWQLVRHLHPTPAVGGYPAPAAIRAIRRTETFDRGWYAGPVGWIGKNDAEFAVALRCALVSGSAMHLYSGAGIVEGSQPEAEWDEIEHKIIDFARILGLAAVPTA